MNDSEKQFEKFVSDIKFNDTPDYGHRNKLEQRLLAAMAKQPRQKPQPLKIWRIIMKSRIIKLAAAAVIIIAVIAAINQFGGFRTGNIYAAVVEQLHNARTMTYSIITQTNIESVPSVRVDFAFKEPGYMRTTTVDGYITTIDWAQNKGISIMPTEKQFIEFEASNYQHDPARDPFVVIEKLRRFLLGQTKCLVKKISTVGRFMASA